MPTSLNAPHVSFPLLHTYIEHPHFNKMNYETLFAICSGYVFKLSLPCILCFTSTLNSMLSLLTSLLTLTITLSTNPKRKEEKIYIGSNLFIILIIFGRSSFIYIQKPAEIDVSAMKSASDSIINYDSRR